MTDDSQSEINPEILEFVNAAPVLVIPVYGYRQCSHCDFPYTGVVAPRFGGFIDVFHAQLSALPEEAAHFNRSRFWDAQISDDKLTIEVAELRSGDEKGTFTIMVWRQTHELQLPRAPR